MYVTSVYHIVHQIEIRMRTKIKCIFFQNYINAYGVAFKHLIFIENLSIYRSVSFTYNSFVCLLGTTAPVLVKYVLILTYWFCLNND